MDQIFNELSASCCYSNKYEACVGMERCVNLFIFFTKNGFSRNLKVTRTFTQLLLSENFTIHNWATSKQINRDFQRIILTAATRQPYIDELFHNAQSDHESIEFTFQEVPAIGLGLAALWNTGVLSLDGDARFTVPYVSVCRTQTDGYAISQENIFVPSLYNQEIAQQFIIHHHKNELDNIKNGEDLYNTRETLFHFLRFAPSTKQQLSNLTGSEQYFRQIIEHLDSLNNAMRDWKPGCLFLPPQEIDWSTESESTMQHYQNQRKFVCDDQRTRTFSLHSKIIYANQRIYFFPDTERRVVHIGYIGDHLPTTRFRT